MENSKIEFTGKSRSTNIRDGCTSLIPFPEPIEICRVSHDLIQKLVYCNGVSIKLYSDVMSHFKVQTLLLYFESPFILFLF